MTPLAPLAAEILDFWFEPRHGERAADDAANARPPSHPGGRPLAEDGAAKSRVRVTRDVWFRKDDAFDQEIRERFSAALAAGIAGAFGEWCTQPLGSLARVVLLDQLTRNAFRGTPDAFAGDPGALATAEDAMERGFDQLLEAQERWFLYMPFEHAESLAQQDRAVACFVALGAATCLTDPLPWAEKHRDVIRRFGRFPHRNEILGRASTPEEVEYLTHPGSRF
ncbi:MAG TPA: DUF924 family protein [Casimicrobiaceae bacterium]|jgi:uncharacterized protein (DUF924 family)